RVPADRKDVVCTKRPPAEGPHGAARAHREPGFTAAADMKDSDCSGDVRMTGKILQRSVWRGGVPAALRDRPHVQKTEEIHRARDNGGPVIFITPSALPQFERGPGGNADLSRLCVTSLCHVRVYVTVSFTGSYARHRRNYAAQTFYPGADLPWEMESIEILAIERGRYSPGDELNAASLP
ncbi:hypothetical protein BaRGS_00013505, partial [Batillaria attramentaria]